MQKPSKFDRAFAHVIGEEGGYVNHPSDPGGETKYGIAKKYHPKEDIKNLTLTRAKEIYYEQYWQPLHIDLVGFPVAYVYFDAAVNMGRRTATKLMQAALGEVSDGIIGPRTRRALKRRGKDFELVVAFQAERAIYYASRPHYEDFKRGWMRRVVRGGMFSVMGETAYEG